MWGEQDVENRNVGMVWDFTTDVIPVTQGNIATRSPSILECVEYGTMV